METATLINARLFAGEPPSRLSGELSYVAMAGGRIVDMGPMSVWRPAAGERLLDAEGGVALPGLINGHCHAAMSLFRGLADDVPLMEWLQRHIFPAEAAWVNEEMVYWASKLAAAEMILSGTTCVADAYFYEHMAAQAFADAGLRAVAAQGVIDYPASGVADPADNILACERFLRTCPRRGLVLPAVFAHAPYTCSSRTLKAAKALARTHGTLFFIHLAETRGEQALIRERFAGSPLAYLHSLGVLDARTVCVHGVWLDAADIGLLAASGAALVTCPESNMKLASGVAPLTALRRAGVPVGLGTDGCASNNDLDLFGEMASCALLHKVTGLDSTLSPAGDVLAMATSEGARVLKMSDLGGLAPGMLADLVVLDLQRPSLTPFFSADTLVYSARGDAVRDVIINGQIVMERRRILTFEVDEVMARVERMARQVAG